jgi:predicted HNH restriction endonuclease
MECNVCGTELIPNENWIGSRIRKQYYICTPCVISRDRERQRALKLRMIEYKGGKCEDCGGTFHPASYDFHHVNPDEKEFSFNRNMSWKKAVKELDKCVLLCSNCHRVRHYKD